MFPHFSTPSVPDKLVQLLAIETKTELGRYVNNLSIDDGELMRLILYSDQIGYAHLRAHKEFQPEDAQLTREDIDIFRVDGAEKRETHLPKVMRKIRNLFDVRKHLSAHLFFSDAKWHLFYFSFRDVECEQSHWKHGSHILFSTICGLIIASSSYSSYCFLAAARRSAIAYTFGM